LCSSHYLTRSDQIYLVGGRLSMSDKDFPHLNSCCVLPNIVRRPSVGARHGSIASSPTDDAPPVACLHHHCILVDCLLPNTRIHKISLSSQPRFPLRHHRRILPARQYRRPPQHLVQNPTCRGQHSSQRPLCHSSSGRWSATGLCVERHLVDLASHMERNRYSGTIHKDGYFTSVANTHVLSAP